MKKQQKKVMVVNSSHWMSEIGGRLAPDCDFAMIWYYDHEDRLNKVSLRAFHDAVDVSELAKTFGGGGHKKAAGFQISGELCVDDIFDIEEDLEPEEPVDTSVAREELKKIQSALDEECDKEAVAKVEEILDKIESSKDEE